MTTNTVYLQTAENQIDENGTNFNFVTFIISENYTVSNTGIRTLPVGASFVALPFGGVSSSSFVKILCDQECSIKINGNSEIYSGITSFISAGTFTGISIRNDSEYPVNITFEFYG